MARIECNFISYSLMRSTDITVILPTLSFPEVINGKTSHGIVQRYPVIYLLHGMGNNHLQWCGYANVELYAEERQIAVVMISGENGFYKDNGKSANFELFLEKELPEFVTSMFPISSRKEDTYLAGLSMGGFGTLYHMIQYPNHYQAVGAFSAAIEHEQGNIVKMTQEAINENMVLPSIYLACGEDDFLYASNLKYHHFLDDHHIDHTWVSKPGYSHEWRFWDQCIERFMDWIPRSDAYKESKRKV